MAEKVIVITGASGGIGAALAKQLASAAKSLSWLRGAKRS